MGRAAVVPNKVVSGGQTGVDRAALDAAMAAGLPCGGWCPRGRWAEDGPIPDWYPLQETPESDPTQRTAWNVRDSDGTLVLAYGMPVGGTARTLATALELGKPFRVVDLLGEPDVRETRSWICDEGIRTLNVAGPRASRSDEIYPLARYFLDRLFG